MLSSLLEIMVIQRKPASHPFALLLHIKKKKKKRLVISIY